jgi:hypothetical protein
MRRSLIAPPTAGRTRSQTNARPDDTNHAFCTEEIEQVYDVAIISDPNEPKTISEALRSDEREQWKESALSELNNFYTRDSWDYVPWMVAQAMGKTSLEASGCSRRRLKQMDL